MIVVIRVDSSSKMGSGHLMRCLTLAEELCDEKNANILFICRDLPGNLSNIVERKGYQLKLLPYDESRQELPGELNEHKQWLGASVNEDRDQTIEVMKDLGEINLLVVDNYALDEAWEAPMRQYVKKIMVIDDLADRKHDCDILLDHNFINGMKARYDGLVPVNCMKLIGPNFALLTRKLDTVRKYRKENKDQSAVRRVLIYLGAADVQKITLDILKNIDLNTSEFRYDVVVGASNIHKQTIKDQCNQSSLFTYHGASSNYFELLKKADLCVGAGGVSLLERLYIGLPTVTFCGATNQVDIVKSSKAFDGVSFCDDAKGIMRSLRELSNKRINALTIRNSYPILRFSASVLNETNYA